MQKNGRLCIKLIMYSGKNAIDIEILMWENSKDYIISYQDL